MAKIILRNRDQYIVTDEEAERVDSFIKDTKLISLQVNSVPLTFRHEDGFWSGSIGDYDSCSFDKKQERSSYFTTGKDGLLRFHNSVGYGVMEDEILHGFGIVDIRTKFLINKGVISIQNNKAIYLGWKSKEEERKWTDLWDIYLTNLDSFNVLLPEDKQKYK